MKWTYSVKQKTTTAILMASVLGLVMWNNFDQSRQFEKIVNSFSSLYEDRLIVESYIYNISELLHKKKHILENPMPPNVSEKRFKQMVLESDSTISELMALYRKTRFTSKERRLFDSLLTDFEKLTGAEQEFLTALPAAENKLIFKTNVLTLIDKNLNYLSALSDIQVAEGKQMNKDSRSALMSNIASSQLETTFLIIIAIIIQMLIFASRSMRSLLKQKPDLN